jgi:hypothetical protein
MCGRAKTPATQGNGEVGNLEEQTGDQRLDVLPRSRELSALSREPVPLWPFFNCSKLDPSDAV